MHNKRIRDSFVYQRDEKDCGAACLLSVLRYHQTDSGLDHLNYLSGASVNGVSLYGLANAAAHFGLNGEGFEATVNDLKSINDPCILHVYINGQYEHFVVLYGHKGSSYLIGDPELGLTIITENELLAIWKSGFLMTFTKTKNFQIKPSTKSKNRRWLLDLVQSDQSKLISSLFLGIIFSALSLATAIYTQVLVDVVLPGKNLELLITSVFGWAVLLFVNILVLYFRGSIIAKWEYNFSTSILSSFFSKLLRLPKSFFDNKKKGDLIARMNDIQRIQSILNQIINEALINGLIVICAIAVLFYYSKEAALIAMLNLPLQFCIIYLFDNRIHGLQKTTIRKYGINEANYIDILDGIELVKSSNSFNYFQQSVVGRYNDFKKSEYSLTRTSILYRVLSSGIGVFVTISAVMHSALLVYQDEMAIGQLLAVLSILFMIISSSNSLVLLNISLKSGKVALQRLYECLEQPIEKETVDNPAPDLVEVKTFSISNLSFSFPACENLFENVTLTVNRGEKIAITGENGSGKSTLINIIQRLVDYEKGSIVINGSIDLKTISLERWRTIMSIVPQKTKLFNMSLWENIALGNGTADQVAVFCKEMGFHEVFNTLPMEYDTLLGEEGVNISGGQQQVVSMARALFRKPQIILLDEATSALDSQTEAIVLNAINKIQVDTAIIMITHSSKLTGFCDKVYKIENGNSIVL